MNVGDKIKTNDGVILIAKHSNQSCEGCYFFNKIGEVSECTMHQELFKSVKCWESEYIDLIFIKTNH